MALYIAGEEMMKDNLDWEIHLEITEERYLLKKQIKLWLRLKHLNSKLLQQPTRRKERILIKK
jgi:hypothetical protein